jgi:hypothetical protein
VVNTIQESKNLLINGNIEEKRGIGILPGRSSSFLFRVRGLDNITVRISEVLVSRRKKNLPFFPTFEYSTSSLLYP